MTRTLPNMPFTFKKNYGISADRDTLFTANPGNKPGLIAITWSGNGKHEVTLQYTEAEVLAFIYGGDSGVETYSNGPRARWIIQSVAVWSPVNIGMYLGTPDVEQPKPTMSFDGATFVQRRDGVRLTAQYGRVFDVMKDKQWRSLSDIAKLTNDPEASISARLRDFRKEKFGAHTVERRHVENGLYEYRLAA